MQRWSLRCLQEQKEMRISAPTGLEPATFGFEDQCAIHCATEPEAVKHHFEIEVET